MCNINYHMVWSVKYRRKILDPEIEEYLKELVQQIAEDKGFTVHLFECGEGDHVHCFVSAPPKLSITAIVKYLKGITGRKLFERFPEIRNQLWKGELWNHSYYVETIGSVSEENIRRYIEHQSKSYSFKADCKYRSALLSEGRKRDAAVTQNICKNPAGIFQYHRAYVLCSFQTLECLQL